MLLSFLTYYVMSRYFEHKLTSAAGFYLDIFDTIETERVCDWKRDPTPFHINWFAYEHYPSYRNFVDTYIAFLFLNNHKSEEIEKSRKLHEDFKKIKIERDFRKKREQIIALVDRIYQYMQNNNDTYLKRYDQLAPIIAYRYYVLSMLGESTHCGFYYGNIPLFLLSPQMNYDNTEENLRFFERIGMTITSNDTLYEIIKKIKKEKGEKAIPYIFRIKFRFNDIQEYDIEEIKKYINKYNDDNARYILYSYKFHQSILTGDKEKWIQTAKKLKELAKERKQEDAVILLNKILNKKIVSYFK